MSVVTELWTRVEKEARPALQLRGSQRRSGTYIGGVPLLPADFAWPEYFGAPMSFLGQIDLEEASSVGHWPDWAPRTGRLVFFYTADQDTWGFDPNDRGSWIVLHIAADVNCIERLPPAELPAHARFERKSLSIAETPSYPSYERVGGYAATMSDEEFDELNGRFEEMELSYPSPQHRLFGWPTPQQGDRMELECQLASNGINVGEPSGYTCPEAKALESGANDWELLLQLDSDDDAKMMWGDIGMLYFWVRREDAARGDFSNVWMILQCH